MSIKVPVCKEAQYCINNGFIDVSDNVEFKTIRDVSDLFNKNYKGFQRSWIKIYDDWKTVASCYQMPENSLYENMLSADGEYFCYSLKENNAQKRIEIVNGIIKHEMQITYLFLKYPETAGYKFVGIFKKDEEAMKKSIKDEKPMVVYRKTSDRLSLKEFFNK